MGLAELGGRDPGSMHSTAMQSSSAAGRSRNTWAKSWIQGAQTGMQEQRLVPAGFHAASIVGRGQICTRTRTRGQSHPSCKRIAKARLPPRSCRPQGDKEQVAPSCSELGAPHHNPSFLDKKQCDRRCFNPRSSSLKLGVGASTSQPCSDSTLYFGN